jgi:DNA-directed RNA polymerase specialized sigma24 family protein
MWICSRGNQPHHTRCERGLERYRRLLHFVAERVLGNSNKAAIAVDNCLYGAAQHVATFNCEGTFRSWLVRLVIDEALMILHGRRPSATSRASRLAIHTTAARSR